MLGLLLTRLNSEEAEVTFMIYFMEVSQYVALHLISLIEVNCEAVSECGKLSKTLDTF